MERRNQVRTTSKDHEDIDIHKRYPRQPDHLSNNQERFVTRRKYI